MVSKSNTATGDKKKAIDERIVKLDYYKSIDPIRRDVLKSFVLYPGKLDDDVVMSKQSAVLKTMLDRGAKSWSFEFRFFAFDGDGLVGKVSGYLEAKAP